jgi:hypothetical protein
MDIEFHYYMTYLIAARAGFKPDEAKVIAHAAQSVDDNHIPVKLKDQNGVEYENSLSQAMDILRPHEDALIYPIFHFIPGDPKALTARRTDGQESTMVTTPDSALANEMIDAALRSKDLYRIGVSAHGYVDTWAHQNFVGARDMFNEFSDGGFSGIAQEIMAVGHAHAKHNPDWPALVWKDSRLVNETVDNRTRFLEAAGCLYQKFALHNNPALSSEALLAEKTQLLADLNADIGPQDDTNESKDWRVANYTRRGASLPYGGMPIPEYVLGTWFSEAIADSRDDVMDKLKLNLHIPVLSDIVDFASDVFADGNRQAVAWRNPDPAVYKEANWFKFQEAVKSHLAECTELLRREQPIS